MLLFESTSYFFSGEHFLIRALLFAHDGGGLKLESPFAFDLFKSLGHLKTLVYSNENDPIA